MAEANPVDPNRIYPAPRPLAPLWTRRWAGFPAAVPPLIGRDREVATLRALLLEPRRRLVTVTGPGGVGKTRLALAVAEDVAAEFADGAAFVALAPLGDPALILPAIARVLDVRESPGRSLRESLIGALGERRVLLVLDNLEHLAGAAATADLAAISEACPGLTVLTTSRIPLHLHDERLFTTPALAVPPTTAALDPLTLTDHGAIALFVERARLAHHGFALTEDNGADVAEICRRLDGLPLAIELAAAWMRVLSPAALLARLEPRLPLLRGGAEDQPNRLRTMRDAIAWSYDRLRDDEQRFFRLLAVFVGGFTLEAAEWVAGSGLQVLGTAHDVRDTGPQPATPLPPEPLFPLPSLPLPRGGVSTGGGSLPQPTALDLLASLIDKSLLQQIETSGDEPRYTMLETVREFGLERLTERGELATVQTAHAAHYLARAEAAVSAAGGAGSGAWMRRLVADRSNLRAALDWFEQAGQAGATLRMAGALWHYWYRHGDLAEGRSRLERALAAAPPDADQGARARALRGAGVLAWQSADYDRSRQRLEEALAAYSALGDRTGAAWVLNSLGCLFATRSETEQAEAFLSDSLGIFRELGDAVGIAQLTANLGELAAGEGRHDLAIARLEAALAMWRDLDDRAGAARAQVFLGQALLARGEAVRAEAVLLEALAAIRDIAYEQILPAALRTAAQLAARRGAAAVAARWYGAEDALRQALGMELPAARRAAHEDAVAIVREALGEHAFTSAWNAGRGLSAEQAVADVLAGVGAVTVIVAPDVRDAGLSPRERQVLTLLIDGRSDREIADALFISQRTASTHVSAILHKLEVGTRAEAAVRAIHEGLV